jgi:methylenetetrahydrofolate reductase (NADPH)
MERRKRRAGKSVSQRVNNFPSRLAERFSTSERVFTVEFPAIDGGNLCAVKSRVDHLLPWFDAANATDSPAAHAHASNVAIAIALQQCGLEPILQVVCRDKNRIAIQSDIMGAALHGVRNIELLTGDDVTAGDEPEARRVFDIDSAQAIKIAATLREGRYLSGRKFPDAPDLFIGAVENAAAPPLEYRAERVSKKVSAGASFFQLQICFHGDRLEKFVSAVNATHPSLPLLPTIVLVKGAKALKFMNGNVAGIDIPAEIIAQVEQASDPKEAAYQLARAQAEHALSLPGVRGIHFTDFCHDDSLVRLMRDLGVTPRSIGKS